MSYIIFIFGFIVLNLNAEDLTPRCGTPPPTDDEVFMSIGKAKTLEPKMMNL